MQHFRLMRVEYIGLVEGVCAEIQPGNAVMDELDWIGQKSNPRETGFQRRMLKLSGYDIGMGISLDLDERTAYVDAVNHLIRVWNGFESRPSLDKFESALRTYLSIGSDVQ